MFDAITNTQISEVTRENVIDVWFSPKGTYFATWERPSKCDVKGVIWRLMFANSGSNLAKLEDGSGSNNLILWESKTGTQLAAFSQKAYSNSYVSLEKSGGSVGEGWIGSRW